MGLRDRLGPVGELVAPTLIVPLNPLRLERVIVEVADEPAGTVRLVGLAEMVKSGFNW